MGEKKLLPVFVHIVESPSDFDLLDGRTEGRSLCEALRLAEIPGWYSLATSKTTFEEALRGRLDDAWKHFGSSATVPLLHLSAHGSNGGIGLTDGTFISWAELREMLQPLNNAMGGNLLICLSSCFSVSGIRMAMFDGGGHPFFGLVGHPDAAQWADAAVAYTSFYHRLFKGATIDEAVEAMRVASGDQRFMWFRGRPLKDDWDRYVSAERSQGLAAALAAYGSP